LLKLTRSTAGAPTFVQENFPGNLYFGPFTAVSPHFKLLS
jgi:hypothetical protein